jgi:hypothetical protein
MTFAQASGAQQNATPPLRMAQVEFPSLLTKSLFKHRSVCKPRIVQTSNTQILNSARLHSGRGCPPARRVSFFEPAGATQRLTMTGAQARAARALLGWSVRELAQKANVQIFTIDQIEGSGGHNAYPGLSAIQSVLEAAGIEFLDGDAPGVRLHPKKWRGK